jgi:RNA polymerase sigma-70 factor (ECF subfamily)
MGPPTLTDDDILTGFLAGRDDAVHHVEGWVYGVLHLGRWRFEDPESVRQEIVMRLLGTVRSGRYAGRSTFKTFVFAVAKYTCVDLFRRERMRTQVETPERVPAPRPLGQPHHELVEKENQELLKYILQGLPEECRRLWGWVYGEGLDAAEVARRLDTNPGTVRVRVHRCLQKARAFALQHHGGTTFA